MNHDNIICSVFITPGKRLNISNYNRLLRSKRYNNIKTYIINRYNDFTTIKESIYRMFYHIEEIPKCPMCGKSTKFNLGYNDSCYATYCSIHCANSDPKVYKAQNATKIQKYGNCVNLQKRKETNIKKYGVEECAQCKEILDKQIKTKILKYNSSNNSYKRWRTIKSDKEKYENVRKKVIDFMNSDEFKEKQYITKKKNKSFNSSKTEILSHELLKAKFPDTIHQYKSKLYPFYCDFYIPSLDLYIECNYHWTHGGHLFNTKETDKDTLKNWESKKSKYYQRAIDTWSKLDILKYEIAKKNKLNYLIFYSLEELKQWLQ